MNLSPIKITLGAIMGLWVVNCNYGLTNILLVTIFKINNLHKKVNGGSCHYPVYSRAYSCLLNMPLCLSHILI